MRLQTHLLFMLITILAVPAAMSRTVIYTTAKYPVTAPQPGEQVQLLEDIRVLEQMLFPALSGTPAQAERDAKQRMQHRDWQVQEARLTRAYQVLLDAYMTGIQKLPAVVFDDKYVVYGTTDVTQARQKLEVWREQQP
ncbi:TIGR03757 family integrating conjugative element protein [Klebsiella pneumoniae]|uniref:TIGR03757 family integrating conjugative element protein n=1 Tax=Klebsiella pneumoniae TaxID=573 RepID=UPI00203B0253|nr:TIGR03757 family integrating conjugative element protein [Klebsiella pneumoniae]USB67181.1 TIGR03757 family integrating conjugative element protein [Klebsiella pneumoniae]